MLFSINLSSISLMKDFPINYKFQKFISLLFLASKDVTNWWLAYWVSTFRYAESHSNISLFNETPSSSQQHAIQSGDSTLPPVSITTSGSNLYFYIGVYLGLAATNSVCSKELKLKYSGKIPQIF